MNLDSQNIGAPIFIFVGVGGLYWGQLLGPTLENMDVIRS